MAVVFEQPGLAARVPLFNGDPQRTVVWRDGQPVSLAAFARAVHERAAQFPDAPAALNLCDDRYEFLLSFCALALRGQVNLLPPSRAPDVVADIAARHPGSHCTGDLPIAEPPPAYLLLGARSDPADRSMGTDQKAEAAAGTVPIGETPHVAGGDTALIGFTSGSTGMPKSNAKAWSSLHASSALNARYLRQHLRIADEAPLNILATVPPQHMYGIETSVLLPLLDFCAVSSARPLFPVEIVAELEKLPAPRLLVTTPIHLRALLDSIDVGGLALPALAGVVCATAPLPSELAARAEAACAAPLVELFGSTETCVIAHRRTALGEVWQLYPGVELRPQPDGTLAQIDYYPQPISLQDLVELREGNRFVLRGRSADLLEIAGKRASLADLTRRLLAVPGVVDGVVFQSRKADGASVGRIVAVAVAPGCTAAGIISHLRRSIDPVFLPRPLRLVDRLPRNDTGKLPQAALDALLRAASD